MNRHASVNRAYRLIWSHSLGAFIPVAETTRGRTKGSGSARSGRALSAAALSLTAAFAHATPIGGQVTAGSGTITQVGSTTTIRQATQTLALDWQSFDIGAQQTVRFVQPSATAIAVNRILSNSATFILGHLDANGQVYLINPNGMIFGRGAEVNVGGLVASTLNLDDGLLGDIKSFSGSGTGAVLNEGTITAATGGSVALLGRTVGNTGVISAQLGSVALGAGSAATLTFRGINLVSMQIDRSVLDSLAANGGLIRADGGQVLMTAGAEKSLLASVVNNAGVIEARTLENHDGAIKLLGGMTAGTVNVGGTLDASAPMTGNGGSVETSAAHVEIAGGAKVTTAAAMGLNGSWLIDPQDFTIAAANGDITGAALTTGLANGNIAIQSSSGATAGNGNINVNDAVSWHANSLTLTAANNVNVNAAVTVSGTGSINLAPGTANGGNAANTNGTVLMGLGPSGFSGHIDVNGTGQVVIQGNTYSVITTLTGLQAMGGSGDYVLGSNIDASATSTWNSGHGFAPVNFVNGALDGFGHTVSNLTIHPANGLYSDVGLIGNNYGTPIRNVGLVNASVSGQFRVGALVGLNYGNTAPILNCYVTGSVSATSSFIGGLVGKNYGNITNSFSTATVSSSGGQQVGGLVGLEISGVISQSYATGNVGAFSWAGGLVGGTYGSGSITNTFATGNVSGSQPGGLVGKLNGPVSKSYSTGTGGGLIGSGSGAVTTSYWDVQTSGVGTAGATTGSHGGVGENTAWMKTAGNFTGAGWNLTPVTGIWGQSAGVNNAYPYLCNLIASCIPVVYVEALTGSSIYGTSPSIGYELVDSAGAVMSLTNATVGGAVVWSGAPTHLSNVGSYSVSYGSGLSTSGAGASNYTLAGWQPPSLWSVTPATLSLSPLAAALQYNRTALNNAAYSSSLANYAVSGYVNGDSASDVAVTLSGSLAFNGAVGTNVLHAGAYTLSAGTLGASLSGGAGGNYLVAITNPLANAIVISPAALTVTGSTVSDKAYDGTTAATISGGTLAGVFAGDSLTLGQSGAFASKNAGAGIAVTANDNLSGTSASDYTLVEPAGLSGSITPATLTVNGTAVGSRVYNGTNTASLGGGSLVGIVGGDTVTLAQAGTFASKNVGTGIAVSAGDSLGGASASNYTITEPIGLTGNITADFLGVTGTNVGTKVYDGTTSASLTGGMLVGVIPGDSVSLVQAGNFASAEPGSSIAVTAMDTLSGASAMNYGVTQPTGLSGTISPSIASAPPTPPVTPVTPTPGGSSVPAQVAQTAATQVQSSFASPRLGASPQAIDASPTIVAMSAPSSGTTASSTNDSLIASSITDSSSASAGSSSSGGSSATGETSPTVPEKAITVDVSMKVGATGTLKIENGGMRLPSNLTVDNR